MFLIKVGMLLILVMLRGIEAVRFGEKAKLGQFKYQALIKTTREGEVDICGGAIIDSIHILTAWHCVRDVTKEDVEVVVGALDRLQDANSVTHKLRKIRLHEKRYCGLEDTTCYDIAILTMKKRIKYSPFVNEISLPTSDIIFGTECVYAGWGSTVLKSESLSKVLRYGYGKIYSPPICFQMIQYPLKPYEFCTHYYGEHKSTPNTGDSGGPLVCNGVLTGILTRVTDGGLAPAILINVYELRDFINTAMDADNCCLRHQACTPS